MARNGYKEQARVRRLRKMLAARIYTSMWIQTKDIAKECKSRDSLCPCIQDDRR